MTPELLGALLEDLAGPARRLMGGAGALGSALERDLRLLRPGTDPARFVAEQLLVGGLTTTTILGILLASGQLTPPGLLLAGMLGLLGFLWPYLRLRAQARDRKRRI